MAESKFQETIQTGERPKLSSAPSTTDSRVHRGKIAHDLEPSYDALVRRLQAISDELVGNGSRAIGVTSTTQGVGVTTVAINLAMAAKKFSPDPVLLVDANAARSTLTRIFQARGRLGLENILAGEASLFDCLVDSPAEDISFIPPGQLASGKRAVYDVNSIDETLDSMKHVFPLIIVDLPPVSNLSNCQVLAGCLDGIVMVVEAGRVNVDVARRAKHRLQQAGASLLGVVLNKQRG